MSTPKALVLGIGNPLWADPGGGIRAGEAFHAARVVSYNVTLMDGGPEGIYLVQHLGDCEALAVFETADYGSRPGTMKSIEGNEARRIQAGLLIDPVTSCVGYDPRVH